MAKVKTLSNLRKKTLVLLAFLYTVDDRLKFPYMRGIRSSIFIKGVIKVLNFASTSTSTYKFVCYGTNSRLRHVAAYATTYVNVGRGVNAIMA